MNGAAAARSVDEMRAAIDRIDDQLLELLAQRAAFVRRIHFLKPLAGSAPRDASREARILKRLRDAAQPPYTFEILARMWAQMFEATESLR